MADDINQQFVAPFSGGARFIQRGLVSPHQVLFAALICLAAGSGIGLFLAATRGWPILVLGLVGVVTLFFYTAPPLQLGYRGLGELIIALDFGILPMLGTEYVLLERCSESTLLLSVPVACMIAAVLGINEFPDADPDALVGKRHLVVILGRATAARLLSWMYALAFGIIAAMVATLWLPAGALCSFVAAIPAGLAAQRLITRPNDSLSWQQACPAGVAAHFSFGLLLFLSLVLAAPIPRG
jgi:1,4-dihydroxy-2-naphthoate octaprenyltransferase